MTTPEHRPAALRARPPASRWLVLAGYVLTLAPSVTFWDAGEFIAAARVLGIPHPPGTPLFVMIAHVWGMLVPVGEYAARTNLLSALLSAAGAGCFFLVAHESLRQLEPAAGSLGRPPPARCSARSPSPTGRTRNETEVYAVATFTIAAMSWTAMLWRRRRGEPRAGRLLLLVVYLAGMLDRQPPARAAGGPRDRRLPRRSPCGPSRPPMPPSGGRSGGRSRWSRGSGRCSIGTGLGSTALIALGALCFLAAAGYAAGGGAGSSPLASLAHRRRSA